MNTQEEARELAARQRHHDDQLRKNELMRSTAEIETTDDKKLQEEARETMMQHRQKEDQLQDNVLKRSTAEVGLPAKTDTN